MLSFQEIIVTLVDFWTKKGCILQQSYDMETGAGTFNPETFLRCLGPEPYSVCNVEISKRPTDGRYGKNPNRLQKFHQFQVIIKPSPKNIQEMYLQSLEAIGLERKKHDFRFVHDDWESPTQGAWGLGWEVWCDGMEVTQFTYFQCVGGQEVKPVVVELAYGIERIAMFLQGVSNIYNVQYSPNLTYGDVFLQSEIQSCQYNFEEANVEMWKRHFEDFEREAKSLLKKGLPIPAYDFAIKSSHAFNILDARSAISTTARVDLMHRIRELAKQVAIGYLAEREKLGFPLLSNLPPEEKKPELSSPIPTTASTKDDLLIEIGSEELPASFVPVGMMQLEKAMQDWLKENDIPYSAIKVYGTPRRLAIHITEVLGGSATETIEKKGPSIDVAFDKEGKLTGAGKGFFKSMNLPEATLKEIERGEFKQLAIRNGKHLYAIVKKTSRSTIEMLAEALPRIIAHLSFPKSMRWANYSETYARPIRWLLALYGKQVIPFAYAGVVSSNITYGHAQMCPRAIKIRHPSKYVRKLKWAKVIPSAVERSAYIEKQLDRFERKLGCKIVEREEVVMENLYLSENPTLASYEFDDRFLSLPSELLTSEMIKHQRYFPLQTADGKIMNQFIASIDKQPNETILKNNQAVLVARLSDGLFLYEQDSKKPLQKFNDDLKNIVFHKELGSIYDKTLRMKELCTKLASLLKKSSPLRAAELCKADLATAVVYEFPELQGIIGKYYAKLSGEMEDTAQAIEEHWWPLTEGGAIPTSVGGSILALADKLDNLMSYWKIGIKATSSKDPYGLRRAAIGVIRILIENKWSLDLAQIITDRELLDFILQRVKGILLDYGLKTEEIDAVMTKVSYDVYDTYCRARGLHDFRKTSDQFDKLYETYKRAKGQIQSESEKSFDRNLLQEDGERKLSDCLDRIKPKLEEAIPEQNYLAAFRTLTTLNEPLANFFDHVHVLAEDPRLRNNRIALLQRVFHYTNNLIDFTRI